MLRWNRMRIRREYFYEVDGEGRLFHDGTELTEPKFLDFFFSRLQPNRTGRNAHCLFVSPCGAEMNYISGTDSPIVFRRLLRAGSDDGAHSAREASDHLLFAGSLSVPFHPERLHCDKSERLFHPASEGVSMLPPGRLGRQVVLELAPLLDIDGSGYTLRWRGQRFPLRGLDGCITGQ